MNPHILTKETLITKNINTVFDFFSKAENLNRITPPELGFNILTPLPLEMKKGTFIEYRIRLNGISFKWKSEITKWEPPYCFEDTQVKGPYKLWIHEHRFKEAGENTLMTDTVKYLTPGGFLEFIPHNLIVRKKVEAIFEYREKVLTEFFKSEL